MFGREIKYRGWATEKRYDSRTPRDRYFKRTYMLEVERYDSDGLVIVEDRAGIMWVVEAETWDSQR